MVDASGLAGARLLGQPAPAREHLCAAAQEIRHVRDPAAARAFFAAHRVPAGDVLGLVGTGRRLLGGQRPPRSPTPTEVSILTGSVPALGHPSGKALLDRFVAEHAWVGERDLRRRRPHPAAAAATTASAATGSRCSATPAARCSRPTAPASAAG